MAEDPNPSLLDQLRSESVRKGTCSVCEWVEAQPNSDEWDAAMRTPWQDINSSVIHRHMLAKGFTRGSKAVQDHRTKGHRGA